MMDMMHRRKFLIAALAGAGAAFAFAPGTAEAAPIEAGATGRFAERWDDAVKRAQVVVVPAHRRRRRRWVCWWRRGRRICGWRWV